MKRISKEDLLHIYHHTEDVWENFRNKNIFLTGATGFFGKWLLESFIYINNKLSLNAELCALSRNPEAFLKLYPFYEQENSVNFIKGDIQTFKFPEQNFNFIIHAATDADATLNQDNPLYMMDTITIGTRRILDFAKQQKKFESFLFVSSGAVYGKQPSHVSHIKESDSFNIDINNPLSAYAEGKRVAELYCSTYFQKFGIPVKIARCFAFVGPYLPLDKHFAVGNFILNAINGEDIIIKGDGTTYRSYLYAADLAIWLWTILLQGKNNQPYNVGSENSLSIEGIAKSVIKLVEHAEVKVMILTKAEKPERYIPDCSLASSTLELRELISLYHAIEKTYNFYKVV